MAVAPTNTLKPQLLVLKEGDFVFEEGDEAIFAYVLIEGEIEILKTVKGEPHVLGKVEKGTVFGEMAIIDGFPRSCLLYTSPSPRDRQKSRMPSSA